MIPAAMRTFVQRLKGLRRDVSGLAVIEMAFATPIFMTMTIGGIELANFTTTKMRISQLATQIADNASRIGDGDLLAAKKISETQINDLLIGAQAQAGNLNIYGNYNEFARNGDGTYSGGSTSKAQARVVISSLEPDPARPGKNFIRWQRCAGAATSYTPRYGLAGDNNLTGMGPSGRRVFAPDGTAIMFVELHYRFVPIFLNAFASFAYKDIDLVSAMIVRDDRDLAGPAPAYGGLYNTEGAPVATCT